jgi:hypothetical protein
MHVTDPQQNLSVGCPCHLLTQFRQDCRYIYNFDETIHKGGAR